tara:strand:- start:247 stop:495 length:249 start_codon:yes stop_codon:yes gene_type:complete
MPSATLRPDAQSSGQSISFSVHATVPAPAAPATSATQPEDVKAAINVKDASRIFFMDAIPFFEILPCNAHRAERLQQIDIAR